MQPNEKKTSQISPVSEVEKTHDKRTRQLKTFKSLIQAVKLCTRLKLTSDEKFRRKISNSFGYPTGYDKTTYKKPLLYFNDADNDNHPILQVELVDKFGTRVKANCILKNQDAVALFFFIPRCEICSEVLPILKDIYQKASVYKKRFQVVSIPYDSSIEETTKSFRMHHGNWVGVEYNNSSMRELLRNAYSVIAVPKIIVIDAKGNIITRTGVEEMQRDGINVLVTWFNSAH